ncbi:MAG: YihY/virulence factor BrkB family protein [Myxococcales bacterium]|nr:YihY/virulence factor BrkB family protein [Myxococcales bacterium]
MDGEQEHSRQSRSLRQRGRALQRALFPDLPQHEARGVRRIWLIATYTLRRWLIEDRGTGLAASLALQTMLSVVPVAGLLLTGVDLLGAERGNELLREIAYLLIPDPERSDRLAGAIVNLAHNITVERLGVVGFFGALVVASLLFTTLEKTVNVIWRVHKQRTTVARFTMFYTLATLGPLVIFYSLAQPVFAAVNEISLAITPMLTTGMAMVLVNRFMPATTVRWKPALIGGLTAALFFEIGKRGFATYIAVIANYESVYGSLAILPVFTVWTYASWLLVLLGVEVAYVVQHMPVVAHDGYVHPSVRRRGTAEVGSGRVAARLMLAIADHFDRQHGGSTLPQLEARYQIGLARISTIVERLEAAGYLLETNAEETSYIPARPLDQIRVRDILALFEGGDVPDVREGDPLAAIYHRLDALSDEVLGELDYQQLLAGRRQRRGSPRDREVEPAPAPESAPDEFASAP